MALSKLLACIAMFFNFIWTNCCFYAQTYAPIRSAQGSCSCSHSLAADLSLSGNGHMTNEKKSEKEICFWFLFVQRDRNRNTSPARPGGPHIAYINPYTIYCIYKRQNILNFPYLNCILKSKNCLHVKRRSFHFNFIFLPFCRQSFTLNEWYDDVIIQTTVSYSLFSFGVCFDSKFFDLNYERYARTLSVLISLWFLFSI